MCIRVRRHCIPIMKDRDIFPPSLAFPCHEIFFGVFVSFPPPLSSPTLFPFFSVSSVCQGRKKKWYPPTPWEHAHFFSLLSFPSLPFFSFLFCFFPFCRASFFALFWDMRFLFQKYGQGRNAWDLLALKVNELVPLPGIIHAETCRYVTGWFRLNAQNCVPD